MKLYTKTGDSGETSLLGGKRVGKDCIEMGAIGEVDELNALLGVIIADMEQSDVSERLIQVQHKLFTLGSQLAAVQTELVDVPEVLDIDVSDLEVWIDELQSQVSELKQFILPGGDRIAAQIFFARAVCRRAERACVGLSKKHEISKLVLQYLNRLSDLLFVLGRFVNKERGVEEVVWEK